MSDNLERNKRVRRSALVLGAVALAFYFAFIVTTITGLRQ
jgi:hypothetical protein